MLSLYPLKKDDEQKSYINDNFQDLTVLWWSLSLQSCLQFLPQSGQNFRFDVGRIAEFRMRNIIFDFRSFFHNRVQTRHSVSYDRKGNTFFLSNLLVSAAADLWLRYLEERQVQPFAFCKPVYSEMSVYPFSSPRLDTR